MRTIEEVIKELKEKSQTHPQGKMGTECYVEKELLKEAATYLQDFLDCQKGEIQQ